MLNLNLQAARAKAEGRIIGETTRRKELVDEVEMEVEASGTDDHLNEEHKQELHDLVKSARDVFEKFKAKAPQTMGQFPQKVEDEAEFKAANEAILGAVKSIVNTGKGA